MVIRDDYVIIVSYFDGIIIVEYVDGIRIIIYYRENIMNVEEGQEMGIVLDILLLNRKLFIICLFKCF